MSTAIERVISRLGGVRKAGENSYRANCPACGGTSRTKFSIKQTDKGVLVHCFGGCDISEILAALGMESAAELYDSVKYERNPAALRTRRIERGLQIWADYRLIEVCRNLRHVEESISEMAKVATDLENEDIAETFAQLYRRRSDLEYEWQVLVSGDLYRIYEEVFRRSK